jgi:hypothetical protein
MGQPPHPKPDNAVAMSSDSSETNPTGGDVASHMIITTKNKTFTDCPIFTAMDRQN